MMKLIDEERAELAIVNSVEFYFQQRLHPRLVVGMEVDATRSMVWYLPPGPNSMRTLDKIAHFFKNQVSSGQMEKLKQQYFIKDQKARRIDSLTFHRKIHSELPSWQALLEEVAGEYDMDWRLLAAISYQESHWNPTATSPTGVRGMMMLTQKTANSLDVKNRLDTRESLSGGAKFFKSLLRRLPGDISEPDRTNMALAAYNIGMGHLEDARVLTELSGADPHVWLDIKHQLPKLQDEDFFPQTRYGFAAGQQAVQYVENINHYWDMLRLQELSRERLHSPIARSELAPGYPNMHLIPLL